MPFDFLSLWVVQPNFLYAVHVNVNTLTREYVIGGPFTNYVNKRRGVGGQKNQLFVNFYVVENVNGGG